MPFQQAGILVDVGIESHRQWCESACASAGLSVRLPLWQPPRCELLDEFIQRGHTARIVVCTGKLSPNFLGRTIDRRLVHELEALCVDASGENGEVLTLVTGGPLFSKAL